MKKLWTWLRQGIRLRRNGYAGQGSRITLVYIQKPPVVSAEKLLEIFAVDPETPWLQAVLSVLAGREEVKKEEAAICELPDSQRSFHAGGVREMADAQEQILDLVKKGNELKKGRNQQAKTK